MVTFKLIHMIKLISLKGEFFKIDCLLNGYFIIPLLLYKSLGRRAIE